MSYILDALKKADQQRQRGAAPSLRSAPEIVHEERKSSVWRFAVPAMLLVVAGAWFAWWQASRSASSSGSQTVAATAPPPLTGQPSAATPFPAMPSTPAPPLPLPNSSPNAFPSEATAKPVPSTSVRSAANATARAAAPAEATSAAEPQAARIWMLDELPLPVRQALPAMTVSLHAWSATPTSRIVSINNQLLHEGDSPATGVTLEEITPDGMIMTFRGYRFRHGVR